MIVEAWKDGSSDIHVGPAPGRERIKIRFRKDGALRTTRAAAQLPQRADRPHQDHGDLDISERRKPQDGKIGFAEVLAAAPGSSCAWRDDPDAQRPRDVVMRIWRRPSPCR